MSNAIIKTDFEFPGQTNVYKGKVRDVYTLGNGILVMVASDRISAFDHILPKGVSPMPLQESQSIWFNGELIPWDDAKIHQRRDPVSAG